MSTTRFRPLSIWTTTVALCANLTVPAADAQPGIQTLESASTGVRGQAPVMTQQTLQLIKAAISDGRIVLHVAETDLDFGAASETDAGLGNTAVTIPVDRGPSSEHSNLTVLFNQSRGITGYVEAHFDSHSDFAGHMMLWHDGQLVENRSITLSPASDIAFNDENTPLGFNEAYHALNTCLADAGVPAWIIAAAGFVCTLATIPGVIACLVASGVGGYTAGKCARAAVGAW